VCNSDFGEDDPEDLSPKNENPHDGADGVNSECVPGDSWDSPLPEKIDVTSLGDTKLKNPAYIKGEAIKTSNQGRKMKKPK